jgi:hypothetical protein
MPHIQSLSMRAVGAARQPPVASACPAPTHAQGGMQQAPRCIHRSTCVLSQATCPAGTHGQAGHGHTLAQQHQSSCNLFLHNQKGVRWKQIPVCMSCSRCVHLKMQSM